MRSITLGLIVAFLLGLCGCGSKSEPKPYGVEPPMYLPGSRRQTWAVAPVVNLSGQKGVDPLLQADLLYTQLQQVAGLNVVPVNRVADVYSSLRITQVNSVRQAMIVCDLLNCDALVVATVTIYDPFEPPKMGASLQVLRRGEYRVPQGVDPRELARAAAPTTVSAFVPEDSVQVVGMFDAANGSVRTRLFSYAAGRSDPNGPFGPRANLVEMDRYAGFVYHELLAETLQKPSLQAP